MQHKVDAGPVNFVFTISEPTVTGGSQDKMVPAPEFNPEFNFNFEFNFGLDLGSVLEWAPRIPDLLPPI